MALVASQYVIEESALPYRARRICRSGYFGKMPFQRSDPTSQFEVVWPTPEKMQVIWHDHIATYGDVVYCMRSACEF